MNRRPRSVLVLKSASKRGLMDALHRAAALEYALIEACHSDASNADNVSRAMLGSRAGAAQVHLFDLGTAMRELGDDSLSYSRCMRHALINGGTHVEVMRRLEREYRTLLARPDLPAGLRVLLRANTVEHTGLRVHREQPIRAVA